ncbi:MAG: hypothetical protein QGG33_03385, partial [Candidatus Krumholzibacteria bacterium]|nr:hypothetical protein [Candidatus Krumholzibacteria bacterium]
MTRSILILALTLLSALPLMAESVLPVEREFASGSRVQIYPADYVRDHFLRQTADMSFLQLPGSPPMELVLPSETVFFDHDPEEA